MFRPDGKEGGSASPPSEWVDFQPPVRDEQAHREEGEAGDHLREFAAGQVQERGARHRERESACGCGCEQRCDPGGVGSDESDAPGHLERPDHSR